MNAKATLLCGICSLGLLAGQAATYHATEGTLEVKDTSLALYYPFDDAASLATDKSGYANGTLTVAGDKAPSFQTDGAFGGCCRFLNDGQTGRFVAETFPNSIPTGANPCTICMWVKTADVYSSTRPMISYGKLGSRSLCEIALTQVSSTVAGTMGVQQLYGSNGYDKRMSVTLPSGDNFGSWHSIVYAFDGTYRMIFLDGDLKDKSKPLYTWDGEFAPEIGTDFFILGRGVENGEQDHPFRGSIDELAIFNRAFDAEDATAYHAKSVGGVSTAIQDGSVFIADKGAAIKVFQQSVVASEASGDGSIEVGKLTVTSRLAGGLSIVGDLTLGVGVAIDASAKKTVAGKVTILGGATVLLTSFPAVYPAYVPVVVSASVEGGENLSSWTVSGLPEGVTATFAASVKGIDLVLMADGSVGSIVHATESTTLADGSLAIYYPFDDAASLATDKSGYANGALKVAGDAAPTCQADGVFGGCCKFLNDGKTGRFEATTFPASVPTGGNPFTICMWAKAGDEYNSDRPMIGYGKKGNSTLVQVSLTQKDSTLAGTDGVLQQFGEKDGWETPSFSGTLPGGKNFASWHSIVVVYDGAKRHLYLDGQVSVADNSPAFSWGAFTPNVGSDFFVIGRTISDPDNQQDHPFRGSIDELAIFNRAFDAADAAAYHAKSVGGVSTVAVKENAILVADEGVTMTVNQYNPKVGGLYGLGTIKCEKMTLGGIVGAGANVEGDLTLGVNSAVEYANDPVVVSGNVSITGAGQVVGADNLSEGTYVLMRAASFSGVDNLRSWRRRVGSMRYVVKVVDNELVLTVVGGGLIIVVE